MLTRWEPVREMNTLRRVMDRMWDEAVERRYTDAEQSTYPMALDVIENVNEFVVKASLPGVQPDDLDITFTNDTLTIQGEVKQDESQGRHQLPSARAFPRQAVPPGAPAC